MWIIWIFSHPLAKSKALRENDAWKAGNAGAWKAMEEAYKEGKVRAIGVSNFMQHHLEALLETAEIVPHVNQILLVQVVPKKIWLPIAESVTFFLKRIAH